MNHEIFERDRQDILIIDCIPDNLQILSSFLTEKGYKVRQACNWSMVLTACQTVLPDLILLDIMLPEVDGYEICQRLKNWNLTADIPVIFLSSLDNVFDKVKAFQVGGVDYITKPFHFEEVLVSVENQLALKVARLKILQLNLDLEKKVKERTCQLEKALYKLQQEWNQRQQLQSKLLEIALHDSLTGLPNRVLFLKRLEQALKRIKLKPDYHFAVLFLDCDRFKLVNDSFGHLVGDELLVAIARRLEASLSPFDTLARFGGDEFTILLENIKDIRMATAVAENILQKLSLPFRLSRHEVFINASIGINWGNPNYEKPEYLLRDADIAMYRAKKAFGKARYHVFDPKMHQEVTELLELENDLRKAVERQEFVVYYQPIISLATGTIAGFEALVRWRHPVRGLVAPTSFISIAEETGLITPINTWVLKSACQILYILQNHPAIKDSVTMSVNISPRLFSQPDLIATIDEVIDDTKINPASLELEITESVLMENDENIKTILHELQKRKIKLVMDDFGTGYSSLSYLHSLPLNSLKIDKSFVKYMQKNKQIMGLVPAMIGIAHSMGMSVSAEGVETQQQLMQLKSLNCDFAQGYLFSPAVQQELVLDLLAEGTRW
jgi:diguanylate cyclase (GGDEF)-like protein